MDPQYQQAPAQPPYPPAQPGAPYGGAPSYPPQQPQPGYVVVAPRAPMNLAPAAMVITALGWFMFGVGFIILGIAILGLSTITGNTSFFTAVNIIDELGAGPMIAGVGALMIGFGSLLGGRR